MVSNLNESINNLVRQKSSLANQADGFLYRDLNKNGKLDIYEDPRQPVEARVEDLLRQMTLEEKAGTMFINGSVVNDDGSIDDLPGTAGPRLSAKAQIARHKMTHFNLWAVPSVKAVAAWHNQIQAFAEQTRLGIPLTIASDPRNHFSHNIFDMLATEFSQWPNAIGFGAIGDPEVVRQFAEFVRQQKADMPHDSENPLYPFGFGLSL